jgi:FkbM family methyltransferase
MDFRQMIELIREYSVEEIFSRVARNNAAQNENFNADTLANFPLGSCLKGYMGISYATYIESLKDLKKNYIHYEWLYEKMSDDRSREVLTLQLELRLTCYLGAIPQMTDKDIPQYFDKAIVSVNENEVFVDCGGFTGDTVLSYIDTFGDKFKRIYTYEPSPENNEKCLENLKAFENVIVRPFGVGDVSTTSKMDIHSSGSAFTDKGSEEIGVVSLDEDVTEPVTFIKMDIEGFEEKALWGARRHITEESPKLAICLYHLLSDIWELPLIINAINPNYDFYMRHYNAEQNWETVLYCIPRTKTEQ